MNTVEREFVENAIEHIQNHKYGAAAEQLSKTDHNQFQAEAERLAELLGNHTEMLGGTLGQVISNYADRLIDDLAKLAHEDSGV